MNTCKEKTIDLLKEIKSVCDAKDIRYFISGELSLFERQGREIRDDFSNGTIAVFAKDAYKLSSALGKKKGRKVESLLNNSSFPGFYMRYMDTSTTLFNFAESAFDYETNSLGINIEIICGYSEDTLKRKMLFKLKEMWVAENAPFYMDRVYRPKGFAQRARRLFFNAACSVSLMKWLFKKWISAGKAETEMCEIATTRGTIVKFKSDLFDDDRTGKSLGTKFNYVKKLKAFNNKYFGGNKRIKPTIFDIYDLDVTWENFSKAIVKTNTPRQKYQREHRKYISWRNREYYPLRSKVHTYYQYMFCAEDRMLMYKEFSGEKKELIMSLYEQRDFAQLREHLNGYIEKINENYSYKIGFCSDPDLFKVALCVMLNEAYDTAQDTAEFNKKCKRIRNIINKTDYRHFDSIENVFWGQREEAEVLQKIKSQLFEDIEQEITCITSTKTSKI